MKTESDKILYERNQKLKKQVVALQQKLKKGAITIAVLRAKITGLQKELKAAKRKK